MGVVVSLLQHMNVVSAFISPHKLLREVVESPSFELFKSVWTWHLEIWFTGEYGSAGSTIFSYANDLLILWTPDRKEYVLVRSYTTHLTGI